MPTEFKDLTAYCYNRDEPVAGVLNVGWLGSHLDYPKGVVDSPVLDRIKALYFQSRKNQMRGYQACWFCREENGINQIESEYQGEKMYLGSAELWIPNDKGTIYAAPDLIIHYIESHDYLPPKEFVEAVMSFDNREWNAEEYSRGILLD